MTHVMKVIIGFTVMISIGLGILYYTDQNITNNPGVQVDASLG